MMLIGMMTSCTDENKRLEYLKKTFPHCKVEPATGMIKDHGYDFIYIDSTNQIVAVSFYSFSETKIRGFRNIR